MNTTSYIVASLHNAINVVSINTILLNVAYFTKWPRNVSLIRNKNNLLQHVILTLSLSAII